MTKKRFLSRADTTGLLIVGGVLVVCVILTIPWSDVWDTIRGWWHTFTTGELPSWHSFVVGVIMCFVGWWLCYFSMDRFDRNKRQQQKNEIGRLREQVRILRRKLYGKEFDDEKEMIR